MRSLLVLQVPQRPGQIEIPVNSPLSDGGPRLRYPVDLRLTLRLVVNAHLHCLAALPEHTPRIARVGHENLFL